MRSLIKFYKYATDRRFSTISGTLVYFLLMSVAPFLFWLTLLLGKLDFSAFTDSQLFSAVNPVLGYFKSAAESASGGAGIIFLATSLYSTTNFFYHLRRSGEIIFGSREREGGIKLRLRSLLVVALVILSFALFALFPIFNAHFLSRFVPDSLIELISLSVSVSFAVFIAYLLNIFACPFRLSFSEAICGSLITVVLWIGGAAGFSVYLIFANPTRLYGAVAAIVVFLLWCYVMMNCLVIGIIFNGMYFNQPVKLITAKEKPAVGGLNSVFNI